jgi:plastocyanin
MAYGPGLSTAAGRPAAAFATDPAPASLTARNDHATSEAGTVTVRISGMRFEPANLSVTPGTTVTWVHGSSMPHTVKGSSPELRSGILTRGQTFSITFEDAGTYNYYCDLHPGMTGTVTVEKNAGGRS